MSIAKGVIVVEAAGNGGSDLDAFTLKGRHILDRASPEFQGESGAIIVGACTSLFPRGAHAVSNSGSRVDCNAWGDHVVVPGSFDQPDNPFLYFLPPSPDVGDVPFGHTSGASAIIAGVCLLIQHLRSILTPADGTTGPLRPDGMRALLQTAANGTLLVPGKIGPMPDLALIIANEFV
jgi:serine protease